MKPGLMVVSAWLVLFSFTACQGGTSNVSQPVAIKGEINVYNWSKYMPAELRDDFTKETGLKVNYEEYDQSEEMMAKLNTGSNYDLVFPGIEVLPVMIAKKMLQPIDKTKVPNFANVDASIVAATQAADKGNQYSLPYNTGIIAIVYWKDLVKNPNTMLDSITMLAKPELKGKIFILDDMREVYGAALCSLGYSPNSINPKEVDAATAVILGWKDNVLQFTNDQIAGFKKQEVYAVLGYPENILDDLSPEEKLNVDVILPKEKSARYLDSMSIPAGAKNVDGALQFINFIYRPENLAKIADLYGYPGISAASQKLRHKIPSYTIKDIESYEIKKPLGDKIDLYAKPWETKNKNWF